MVPYLQRNWRKKFISVSGVDLGGNFFHWTLRKTCSWKSSQLSQLLFSILRAIKPDLTTTRSFLTWILILTSNIKFRMNQPYIHCSQWCWVLHEHTKRDIFALTKSLGFEEKRMNLWLPTQLSLWKWMSVNCPGSFHWLVKVMPKQKSFKLN